MMRAFACVLLVLAAVPASAGAALRVETVSTRPEMVTGGDVLVRVTGAASGDVAVSVDGRDVTGSFRRSDDGLLGLVDGLDIGRHRLTARAGRDTARLTLTNSPIAGPVFSGPHEQPFVCETESAGLGPPLDADCSIATRVEHVYRTTTGEFAPWPDGATDYPADMARTATTQGRTVPYVVRKETGTINRGIYEIALLEDPLANDRRGWNGRLIYNFGGGCIGGWYRQGPGTAGVLDDFMLRNGYAVASSSRTCSATTARRSPQPRR